MRKDPGKAANLANAVETDRAGKQGAKEGAGLKRDRPSGRGGDDGPGLRKGRAKCVVATEECKLTETDEHIRAPGRVAGIGSRQVGRNAVLDGPPRRASGGSK